MTRSSEQLLQLLQQFLKNPKQIQQIHSLLITHGHLLYSPKTQSNLKWMSTLLHNALIRAYVGVGHAHRSLLLFNHMLASQVAPNSHTFPPIIKSATVYSPSFGKHIHSQAVKRGVLNDPFVRTSFVGLFAGELSDAQKMFDEITKPCIVACNVMLDALAKNGDMGSAILLFESMFERDVVSWTSVINGFCKNGCFIEAIRVFARMMRSKDVMSCLVKPNEATYVSVLSSCANLDRVGALCGGKELHCYMIKNEVEEFSVFMGTALINFYGKMGVLESAMNVFHQMRRVKKVCTWNAMITSLSSNGREKEALDLFAKLKEENIHPNEVTYVAVLTACARGKLVELGLKLFQSMLNEFSVEPIMEHYGCVVDLLGRAGLLDEATEFVRNMPFEPDGSVLGALLGACKVHGATELGNEVGRRLVGLQPWHCGQYVMLSNIYAGVGKWGPAAEIRKAMVDAGIKKVPAFSMTDSDKLILEGPFTLSHSLY